VERNIKFPPDPRGLTPVFSIDAPHLEKISLLGEIKEGQSQMEDM